MTQFGKVGGVRDLIDASAFGDDFKDYVLGQQDGSEVPYTFAFDPADSGHQAFIDAFGTSEVVTFTVSHDDAGFSADVSAIIVSQEYGGDLGGLFELSGNLKIVSPGVVVAS